MTGSGPTRSLECLIEDDKIHMLEMHLSISGIHFDIVVLTRSALLEFEFAP
jgi:hypothetical protein